MIDHAWLICVFAAIIWTDEENIPKNWLTVALQMFPVKKIAMESFHCVPMSTRMDLVNSTDPVKMV